jgi:hypothetical protein
MKYAVKAFKLRDLMLMLLSAALALVIKASRPPPIIPILNFLYNYKTIGFLKFLLNCIIVARAVKAIYVSDDFDKQQKSYSANQ